MRIATICLARAAAIALPGCSGGKPEGKVEILNLPYDPTRKLYRDINSAFARQRIGKTGRTIRSNLSHGGSAAAKHAGTLPQVATLQIDEDFGGWGAVQKKYFDDGGVFDSIYSGIRRR